MLMYEVSFTEAQVRAVVQESCVLERQDRESGYLNKCLPSNHSQIITWFDAFPQLGNGREQ